jgi:hypothetical protein
MVEIDGNEPGIPRGTANLSDLTWTYAADRNGIPSKYAGLSINGTPYTSVLKIGAGSKIMYRLAKRCSNLTAVMGVVGPTNVGSVQFQIWADGERLYPSGDLTTMKGGDPDQNVSVDLTGKYRLTLLVTNAGDGSSGDDAYWANAQITCAP